MRIFYQLALSILLLQFYSKASFAYYSDFAKQAPSPNQQAAEQDQFKINNPKSDGNIPESQMQASQTKQQTIEDDGYVITKNLQNKIDRSSGFRGGVGGYLSFDRKSYEEDKNKEQQDQAKARRRFSFVNPNKYGSINYKNDEFTKNKKNINANRFLDVDGYFGLLYSSSINTTLKSDKQYGGENSNSSPLSKSYGFGFMFAQQLFNEDTSTNNKKYTNTYDSINRNALIRGVRVKNNNIIKAKSRYANFKKSVRDILGENLLFAEYSINMAFNEFTGKPSVANSAPINKSLSGVFASVKIIYMPKLLNKNITISKNIVIPTQIFVFPELGYGYFGYKNILDFDQSKTNPVTKTAPQDIVIKQSFLKPIYGIGVGSFFDLTNALKSKNNIITRVDIKYLQTPSMSVVASNSLYNENLKYSNLSINYSLIFNF